jgi:hypothetical protein
MQYIKGIYFTEEESADTKLSKAAALSQDEFYANF